MLFVRGKKKTKTGNVFTVCIFTQAGKGNSLPSEWGNSLGPQRGKKISQSVTSEKLTLYSRVFPLRYEKVLEKVR